MIYLREQIDAAVKAKGYAYFAGAKDYDVNIIGVRNSAPGQKVTNLFDDSNLPQITITTVTVVVHHFACTITVIETMYFLYTVVN